MRRMVLCITLIMLVAACGPVIRKDLMESAAKDVTFGQVIKDPEAHKGKLFILGGIITSTKASEEGALIEAIHVDVDSSGRLGRVKKTARRYLALYPKAAGFLDPLIYRKGREITVAGVLTGVRQGKIDEMDYAFPLFEIKDIHLWSEEPQYGPPPPYWYTPYYYPHPYWWYDDPSWRYRQNNPWYPY